MTSFQTFAFQIFHPSKHWNSKNHPYKKLIFKFRLLFFRTVIWNLNGIFSNHLNSECLSSKDSDFILPNTWILALSIQILEYWAYTSKLWNSDLVVPNNLILTLSLQTPELWPYLFKINIGILTLFFQTLDLWPNPFNAMLLLNLSKHQKSRRRTAEIPTCR